MAACLTYSTFTTHLRSDTLIVYARTSVVWEANGQRAFLDFLLKQIFLIEEKDDGRLLKPLIVADAVKQLHALVHAVLRGKELRINKSNKAARSLLRTPDRDLNDYASVLDHMTSYRMYVTAL